MSSLKQNEYKTTKPPNLTAFNTDSLVHKDDGLYEPSCLDSPSSILSPTSLQASSSSLQSPTQLTSPNINTSASSGVVSANVSSAALNDSDGDITHKFSIIRKLGAAEIIYDYEHSIGNVILAHSFVIESKINLFQDLNLLNQAFVYWKNHYSLLRSCIFTIDQPASTAANIKTSSPNVVECAQLQHQKTHKNDKLCCSTEKYFIYASEDKILNNENVKLYKLNLNDIDLNKSQIEQLCRLLYDREYNIEFLDSANGPLWRLTLIQTKSNSSSNNYNYYLIFTVHHAIVDARNVHCLILKLFEIIENLYLGSHSSYSQVFDKHFEPSIEERLFNNDQKQLKQINVVNNENSLELDTNTSKILESFSLGSSKTESVNNNYYNYLKIKLNLDDKTINSINFEAVSLNDINKQSLKLTDLLNEMACFSNKTRNFKLTETSFKKLLKNCKLNNVKLTGCLNIIAVLATRKLYLNYTNERNFLNIHYHSLVNLRPFLKPPIDNNIIGYWAVVLTSMFKSNSENFIDDNNNNQTESENFWQSKFWQLAKHESDNIHKRIDQNEHIENAKFDTALLEVINSGETFPNGGGVHFALSNLGVMPTANKDCKHIEIKEHYFGTSAQPNRWSAVVFHGVTTVDNNLCWSITYNAKEFRDDLIELLIQNINEIFGHIAIDLN